MEKWWDRRWRVVIAAVLLPILLVPIASRFLSPETPLTIALLYGGLLSLFVASVFRVLQHMEWWGLRAVILVRVAAALLALLLGFGFKIWRP